MFVAGLILPPDISLPSQYIKPDVDEDIVVMLMTVFWKCSASNSAIWLSCLSQNYFSTLLIFNGFFIRRFSFMIL